MNRLLVTYWLSRFWQRIPNRAALTELWRQGDATLGKPEWFRPKRGGLGLRPVRWQGWIYAAAWIAVMAMPLVGLLERHLVPEAIVWATLSAAALMWDVRKIRKAHDRQAPPELAASKLASQSSV